MTRFKTLALALPAFALLAGAVHAASHGQGSGERMAGFIQEWDMNGDGEVTLGDLETRRTDLFDMFDLNGDRGIDAEEQANMAATIASSQEANDGGERQGGERQGGERQGGERQGGGRQGGGRQGGEREAGGRGGPGQMIHAAMTAEFADADSDGVVSADEWSADTPRLFADLDRNGDGSLNQMDFRRASH